MPPRTAPPSRDSLPPSNALSTLVQQRPPTTRSAAEALDVDLEETRGILAALARDREITWDGEAIGYRAPEQRLIEQVGEQLDAGRAHLREVEQLIARLPSLLEDWSIGTDPHAGRSAIEIADGPLHMEQLWTRRFAWRSPRRIRMLLPDVAVAERFGHDPESAELFLHGEQVDIRTVVSTAQLAAEPERIAAVMAPSVALRAHPRLASWIMVSDDTVVLPRQWGGSPFEGIVVITEPTVASLAHAHLDGVWEQAVDPRRPRDRPWTGVLEHLARGASIDTAGRALGISLRTAQRRVSAAMRHYGATSLFELAVKWNGEPSASDASDAGSAPGDG
ncbi:hypothetical protein J4H92_02325 [Leucobacter weissii]|uniref:HTH luxR-type domain-containing protein n=1 Tax=Leucobacter weissii TaxID=1983706 RepID=A0A939MHM9_9MICO|nr:hypothetical protein [Leucobacter weissii]MBO1900781.1 hypothetical protein [Leucobacter weissii]